MSRQSKANHDPLGAMHDEPRARSGWSSRWSCIGALFGLTLTSSACDWLDYDQDDLEASEPEPEEDWRTCEPNTGTVEAGPLWDDEHAQSTCPAVCADGGGTFTGQWWTTESDEMSVCKCDTSCRSYDFDVEPGQHFRLSAQWTGGLLCLGIDAEQGTNAVIRHCQDVAETFSIGDDGKLRAGWDDELCIDASGSEGASDGASVQLGRCDEVDGRWRLGPDDKIHADRDPDLCMQLPGHDKTTSGRSITLGACSSVSETWTAEPVPAPFSLELQDSTERCLDVEGALDFEPGGGLGLSSCADGGDQFYFEDRRLHAYWAPNLCVGISREDFLFTEGVSVQMVPCASSLAWWSVAASGKIYLEYVPSLCLDVPDASAGSEAGARLSLCDEVQQAWTIVDEPFDVLDR
ncbi:MAG: ricin-type beta-trefoil lectin domain protein [Nannocystaceae bacterium]